LLLGEGNRIFRHVSPGVRLPVTIQRAWRLAEVCGLLTAVLAERQAFHLVQRGLGLLLITLPTDALDSGVGFVTASPVRLYIKLDAFAALFTITATDGITAN